ncbi:hypothetical protein TSTA_007720 [Talaromyces stipitatus ATCC 10500]|uniref:Protein kinase domain-containing protein n=1 Tax=Talaromyces stipitatus (strain ATCC 10500 / CBS 375.48 / QM 6759 / NRRL 1006) TaxID=441959 RepID=B8MVH4_TALSN|nr:uncharacterized protein TSTA_007720 [Talaromyces stipitatus ATCC 10500]EED11482.1 hypothetical protein TSTA_007720 [Talaromyces stipitatus ATCC 10500]
MSMTSHSSVSSQVDEYEEIPDKGATSQRPFVFWEMFPFSRMDSIFIRFPGDISSQPTLVKKMTVSDSLRKYDLVRRTNHPNLVNLTGMSRTGDGLYFSYERPGASLKKLYALKSRDAVAMASICKKVSNTQALLSFIHLVPTFEKDIADSLAAVAALALIGVGFVDVVEVCA